ncbi:amidohydrolase family protein [Rhizorhabdus sp.]|uniref:amidohydrolase family protein n=1 Tax=Rhizorhabdus sp. TaxID=1968843 RepID=UPI0019C34E7E|nr:amidohydrolase family protein [Rhizorhabdus sp.]MBD3759341.1 amidohydrolase [Rhizorhabdus sp.]
MSVDVADRLRCFCPKCIDFHAHFLQREVFEKGHPHSASSGFGRTPFPLELPAIQKMFHPEMQIEDMDRIGIDINVLTACDAAANRSWAPPQEEHRLAALANEECARWVSAYPTRFIGTAVLPLSDIRMTLAELDRVLSAGTKIVVLPSNFRGDYLGHPRFFDLWAMLEDREVVTFIHPDGITEHWFQDYSLWNSIGQSIEEVRVMSTLIYEGVMDRFPNLKIVMAHGGGYMPHYMGRLDRNVIERPFTAKNLSKKPSEYLSDFYYDSCVYDPRTLEILVERVGIDRVVLGGDYPAAHIDQIDFLAETKLSTEDQARIAGGNVSRLLGLS